MKRSSTWLRQFAEYVHINNWLQIGVKLEILPNPALYWVVLEWGWRRVRFMGVSLSAWLVAGSDSPHPLPPPTQVFRDMHLSGPGSKWADGLHAPSTLLETQSQEYESILVWGDWGYFNSIPGLRGVYFETQPMFYEQCTVPSYRLSVCVETPQPRPDLRVHVGGFIFIS